MATILVIDDEPGIRSFVRAVLESDGHTVRQAPDGDAGIRVFRAQPVDLVICDVIMPNREGLEVIGELQAISPMTPIIVVTGGGRFCGPEQLLAVAKHLGAANTLPKPFTTQQLLDTVHATLHQGALTYAD